MQVFWPLASWRSKYWGVMKSAACSRPRKMQWSTLTVDIDQLSNVVCDRKNSGFLLVDSSKGLGFLNPKLRLQYSNGWCQPADFFSIAALFIKPKYSMAKFWYCGVDPNFSQQTIFNHPLHPLINLTTRNDIFVYPSNYPFTLNFPQTILLSTLNGFVCTFSNVLLGFTWNNKSLLQF